MHMETSSVNSQKSQALVLHHAQMMRPSSYGLLKVLNCKHSEAIWALYSQLRLWLQERSCLEEMIAQSGFGIHKTVHVNNQFSFQEQSGP